MLEILPDGKITKKHIDIEKQEKIIEELHLEHISPSFDNAYTRKSHITTWDKKQIIFEQKVEKIDLRR